MKVFFQKTISEDDAVPAAVIAIQSFGDFLGYNPHLHILCSDGCFYGDGMFRVSPRFETNGLEKIFRHQVFKMLLSKVKITQDLVNMLTNWRHSGFNVFCGPRLQPGDEKAMRNLARYIIRASFSQERMTYVPEKSRVIYRSKDGKGEKIFDALEYPRQKAAGCKHSLPCLSGRSFSEGRCSHVPNKGEQMVRYYGHYSNVAPGKRKKQDQDCFIPSHLSSPYANAFLSSVEPRPKRNDHQMMRRLCS